MLTAADLPTIRYAIMRRISGLHGVTYSEVKMKPHPGYIAVGVLVEIGRHVLATSRFDLPDPFELAHLHNEIDEIAEHIKAVRKNGGKGLLTLPERQIAGSGLRGRWLRYG